MTPLPYVIPFAVVVAFLAARPFLSWSPLVEQVVWVSLMTATLALVARPALQFRVRDWLGTAVGGVAVFLIWIGPDWMFPGYRSHWLFSNALTGSVGQGLTEASRGDWATVALRSVRAAVLVPIAEELFWRGWLMRWLIAARFTDVPLGAWSARAFWIVALLFAAEHGPFWDVGLAAGILYNAWIVRTKSLADVILAHAVTNGCLCAYIVLAGRWEYWP